MIYHQFIVFHCDLVVKFHNIILRAYRLDIIVDFLTVLAALDIHFSLIIGADIKCLITGHLFLMTHKCNLVIYISDHRTFFRAGLGIDLQSRIIINILCQFQITIHVFVGDLITNGT